MGAAFLSNKKALKSNRKQLDLRAMRHLDIILTKKPVSSISPRDDFGEAKSPYIFITGFPKNLSLSYLVLAIPSV